MKRIGLLGGMSWESSAEYYRFVNLGIVDDSSGQAYQRVIGELALTP
jgi:aspartate/glutamate racemase